MSKPPTSPLETLAARIWLVQGLYDLVTGLWGLLEIRSFQKVTGPKTDTWLVKTVSVLVVVIGAVLLRAGGKQRITPEIAALAVGTNLGLGAIDLVYTAKRRISPVYLLDLLGGLALTTGWFVAIRRRLLPLRR